MSLKDEMQQHIGKYVTIWKKGIDKYRSGTLEYYGDYIKIVNINTVNYIFLEEVEEIVVSEVG